MASHFGERLKPDLRRLLAPLTVQGDGTEWIGAVIAGGRMELSDEEFNRAFEIYDEWGPRRRIPVQQRWQDAFPQANPDAMSEWQKQCRAIEDYAYSVAQQVNAHQIGQRAAAQLIAEHFPRLAAARVKATLIKALSRAAQ